MSTLRSLPATLAILGISTTTHAAQTPPGLLPLLDTQQSIGILYSQIDPPHQDAIDEAYIELLDRGMHGLAGFVNWADMLNADGSINTAELVQSLENITVLGLTPYLVIATIDTNNLQVPWEYRDPGDERELAPGMRFDSPEMIARFGELLDVVVPILIEHDGFYLSVGNEVDIWLAQRPDQIEAYTSFVQAAKERIQSIAPQLAVGATLTSNVLVSPKTWTPVLDVSDAISYTYYHIDETGVLEASLFPQVLDDLVGLAGEKQILFQEIGIPSGWATDTTIGGSVELQRQFVETLFPEMASHPQIRFWSFLTLGDWSDEQVAYFSEYYGIDTPEFIEYLGTLGLIWNDGTPKPGYQEFLMGLGGCAADVNADGRIDLDDLHTLIQTPADINGDGIADEEDSRCLEKYLRRFEMRDLVAQP